MLTTQLQEKAIFTLTKYFEDIYDWNKEDIDEVIEDLYPFFDIMSLKPYTVIQNIKKLQELRKMPLIPQRSKEWYDLRLNRLTASDLAQALNKGKFGTREDLLKNKAFPETVVFNNHCPPLKWGTMFEDMGMRMYYQKVNPVKIYDFGLIPNNEIYCFGASPDGITDTGVMVEMKCPYRRKCNGEIPEQYYIQIQGQLATCKLTDCDYVECYFEVFNDISNFKEVCLEDKNKEFGIIVEYMENNSYAYYYSPELLCVEDCIEWAYKKIEEEKLKENETYNFLKMTYWKLKKIFVKRVPFQEEEWNEMVPEIYRFWDDVKILRDKGIESIPVKPKNPKKRELELDKPKSNYYPNYVFIDDSDEEN